MEFVTLSSPHCSNFKCTNRHDLEKQSHSTATVVSLKRMDVDCSVIWTSVLRSRQFVSAIADYEKGFQWIQRNMATLVLSQSLVNSRPKNEVQSWQQANSIES
ncbi:hypothetical protein Ae201684_013311 [Aphanomyces euteiches]|uniref:Uncharacterized protein n=1 Tax=Aphanomyces euteiches TaxID=100861 RepID=A0A6G0WNV6_9STRA|nr:hypothetical protein Ae201684_013311 [Aphanomyces euteiches]